MYPSRDVTFISALMNSFVLYVKRSIVCVCVCVCVCVVLHSLKDLIVVFVFSFTSNYKVLDNLISRN